MRKKATLMSTGTYSECIEIQNIVRHIQTMLVQHYNLGASAVGLGGQANFELYCSWQTGGEQNHKSALWLEWPGKVPPVGMKVNALQAEFV